MTEKIKKNLPLSNQMLDKIESYCASTESACNKYNCGSPVWTEFLDKKYKLLKEYSSKHYDEILIASYFVSPPPYTIEVPKEEIESQSCCWKTEEII